MAQHHNDQAAEESQPDFTQLSQSRRDFLNVAEEAFAEFHPEPGVLKDLPEFKVAPDLIDELCRTAKSDPRLDCNMLLCAACVDYEEYLQMVYFLHSLTHEQTLVIKADVSYDAPRLPSVTPVWSAAEWYEREAHDLFGVEFEGHPDMSPLLLYEEFEGYPGRKEYPLHDYQEF